MRRLKSGDVVQVIAGDDKGKRGKVLRVDVSAQHVVVQGINLVYRHMRRSQKYPQGGRIQKEAPVHISNVMLFSEDEGRPVRLRVRAEGDRRIRVSARSGKPI
ncbi:MAG: 50S ribosomal protein L24 [Planctomycetota bacterium]